MNYSEKLKDPRWQKKRLEILSRDQFTCTFCGDKETTLHIHHEKYKGEPWDVDSNYLKTVCMYCHSVLESIHRDDRMYLIRANKVKSVSHLCIIVFSKFPEDVSESVIFFSCEHNGNNLKYIGRFGPEFILDVYYKMKKNYAK